MSFLILYATTEGHTRRVARFLARRLAARGAAVELLPVADATGADLADRAGVVLLGSIHNWRLQPELVHFAEANAPALQAAGALLLPVSLAAASPARDDKDNLDICLKTFSADTGWRPAVVLHVGGALRWREYGFLENWAMRYLAARLGGAEPGVDRDYTDWDGLAAFADGLAAEGRGGARAQA
jgi:menaquinone-dependent protoporphyrinogen oxidase